MALKSKIVYPLLSSEQVNNGILNREDFNRSNQSESPKLDLLGQPMIRIVFTDYLPLFSKRDGCLLPYGIFYSSSEKGCRP